MPARLSACAFLFLLGVGAGHGAAPPFVPGLVTATHLDGQLYLMRAARCPDTWFAYRTYPVFRNWLLRLPITGARKGVTRALPTRDDTAAWSFHVAAGHVFSSIWAAADPAFLDAFPLSGFD